MSGAVAKAAKPALRGFLQNQIKKNLIVGVTLCIAAGILMKVGINDPVKARYAEFYKSYDIEKDFVRIKNLGLFESCGASD